MCAPLRLPAGRSRSDLQRELTRFAGELGPDPVTGHQSVLVADSMLDFVSAT